MRNVSKELHTMFIAVQKSLSIVYYFHTYANGGNDFGDVAKKFFGFSTRYHVKFLF